MSEVSTYVFPKKVLTCVFTFFHPKTLVTFRLVCLRWRQCVDKVTMMRGLWRQHCRRDYPDVWDSAHLKAYPGLTWYHVYRSLTLWPKVKSARASREEIPVATFSPDDVIKDFQVLRYGIVAIHTRKTIVYYDLTTRQEKGRIDLPTCIKFTNYIFKQNNVITALMSNDKCLYVTWLSIKTSFQYRDVKLFLLLESCIYFVTVYEKIYLCKIKNGQVTKTKLKQIADGVKLISFRNSVLYILTSFDAIYSLDVGKLRLVSRYSEQHVLMGELKFYNFINQKISRKSVMDIALDLPFGALYSYGRVLFHGTISGQLGVFNSENETTTFIMKSFIFHSYVEPCKPVIHIDSVEGHDSHTLLAATPNKLVILQFNHIGIS